MTCTVPTVREHGYDIAIAGAMPDGAAVFTARFSPICIHRSERRRAPIPPGMLAALARHRPATA